MDKFAAFKAYDIRGKIPEELNENIAYEVGRAFVSLLKAKTIVVGGDIRQTTPVIKAALIQGLLEQGADVVDIGLCGTEEIYFATAQHGFDGGIMVTASHNPMGYNGLKMVGKGATPLLGDYSLDHIKDIIENESYAETNKKGELKNKNYRDSFIQHLLSYIDRTQLKPLKVVMNAGNGCAGPIIDAIEKHLAIEIIKINNEPDGTFPNGIPNPLLHDRRQQTVDAVLAHQANLGIAWDGDCDRCFFFDEKGEFIEGYYIVGLLAEAFLDKYKNETIIYDPRLTWNTVSIIEENNGSPIESQTGHVFVKKTMRDHDAIYGGEMSAHHYFRDFAYCDSGMIPWLLVIELMSIRGKKLSEKIDEDKSAFPVSGEINRKVYGAKKILVEIENLYKDKAVSIKKLDGLSMEFEKWRFNLRCSNTEPLLRLNVESRHDHPLMEEKRDELLAIIDKQHSDSH